MKLKLFYYLVLCTSLASLSQNDVETKICYYENSVYQNRITRLEKTSPNCLKMLAKNEYTSIYFDGRGNDSVTIKEGGETIVDTLLLKNSNHYEKIWQGKIGNFNRLELEINGLFIPIKFDINQIEFCSIIIKPFIDEQLISGFDSTFENDSIPRLIEKKIVSKNRLEIHLISFDYHEFLLKEKTCF